MTMKKEFTPQRDKTEDQDFEKPLNDEYLFSRKKRAKEEGISLPIFPPSRLEGNGTFSLIELLLCLAVVAVVAIAAFIIFPLVKDGRIALQAHKEISKVIEGHASEDFLVKNNTVIAKNEFGQQMMSAFSRKYNTYKANGVRAYHSSVFFLCRDIVKMTDKEIVLTPSKCEK